MMFRALRYDRARRRSADEDRQAQLCQIMWSMRHVALTLALVLGIGDGVGPYDGLVAALLAIQVVSHVVTRVSRRYAPLVTVLDAAVLIAFAALGLDPLLVFVLGIGILGWAATFRPIAAISAYAAVVVAVLAAFTRAHGAVRPGTAVVAFCMLGAIFMVRSIRLNMGARRSTEREQLVAERVDAILWEELLDADGAIKVSPAAERLLGYPATAWARPGFAASIVHPDDRRLLEAALAGRLDQPVTVRMRRADGQWRSLESRTNRVTDRGGRTAFLVGVLLDRTEAIETEREALAFGHLVAASPIGQVLLRCDGEGPVIEALNQASQHILGVGPDAVGTYLTDHGRPEVAIDELVALLPGSREIRTTEFRGANGRVHQATVQRIDDHSCSIDFLDITERVAASARLHAQARRDHLTGLPNRRAFIEALEARLSESDGEPTSVLLIDLDHFKDVNDSLGHETGDQLLCRVGTRILGSTRTRDLVARLGGDEFAVILSGVSPETAVERASDLVDAINRPVVVGDLRLRVRASVGVASAPHDADDVAELLRCADVAMYRAKVQDASVERYDPDSVSFGRDRLALVADLETAIANDQLFLLHQPLLDVTTGIVIGSEVLARWDHPTRGVMSPDTFVELAEVSGQMKGLTRWVIRRALRDLRSLGDAGSHLEVSVNLSVRNLYEPDLLDWIAAELAACQVHPSRLVVEITEGTIMDDHGAAVEVIRGLAELGVRTWIDDFGTGHSSFARLRTLPVQGVKIDRAFVSAAPVSAADRALLSSLIELVESLGLQSIAEGVETPACLELLEELGCDTAQGYYVGRPAPLEQLAALLTDPVDPVTDITAPVVA